MKDHAAELAPSLLRDLLNRSRMAEPDDVPQVIQDLARTAGAVGLTLYLADYEQVALVPLPLRNGVPGEALEIDRTLAGRAFRQTEVLTTPDGHGVVRWYPLLDGTDRLGVIRLVLPEDDETAHEVWQAFTALTAELLVSKGSYGDLLERARRRHPLELRAELQRSLLPPQTLATPRVVISGMLEPAYEVAGDVFDYAVNDDIAHVAIFDAMGHSLRASLIASVAVACYRNSRRRGEGLEATLAALDRAVNREFGEETFATALLAELHLTDGMLRAVTAGHAPPLLVRQGRVVRNADPEPTLPIGLGADASTLTEQSLEPGDRLLLFTDGIVEARAETGEFFGQQRLVDLLAREAAAGNSAPETVRRLVRAVVDHQSQRLQDDATLLVVEWLGGDRGRSVDLHRLV